jgi:DNA primase catalytic core
MEKEALMALISNEYITDLTEEPILNVLSALNVRTFGKGSQVQVRCISPGHDDKNPSMSVNTDTGAFFCQGCGASGQGAISCYATHERRNLELEFPAIVEDLSSLLGKTVEYQDENSPAQNKRTEMFNAMFEAMKDFIQIPTESSELEMYGKFLVDRGLTRKDKSVFKFGYVPKNWYKSETAKRHQSTLLELGLLKRDLDNPSRIYSPLAGRVVFPITDERGRIMAMAGRDLTGKAKAKYRNTDTTQIFKKSKALYGINEMLQAMPESAGRKKVDSIAVVEGYMDTIASHREKLTNTVATMGTAMTTDHIKALARYTDSITFVFDPDDAGQRASDRALLAALPFTGEIDFNIVRLPMIGDVKYDPDRFIKDFGGSALLNAYSEKTPIAVAASRYIMGTDDPKSVYELLQDGMPKRADEVYQALPDGIVKPLIAVEIAKVISAKLDVSLTPNQLGMAFDQSIENKALKEELAQYRSGNTPKVAPVKESVEKNSAHAEHANSKQNHSNQEKANSSQQEKTGNKSHSKNNNQNTKQENTSSNKNSSPAPKDPLPFNTRYISNVRPEEGYFVALESGLIGTVTSIEGQIAKLRGADGNELPSKPLSDLITLSPDRALPSRYENKSTGLQVGDTILQMGQVYAHSLDPTWYEAASELLINPVLTNNTDFLKELAVTNLIFEKVTDKNDFNKAVDGFEKLNLIELQELLKIDQLNLPPKVIASGYATPQPKPSQQSESRKPKEQTPPAAVPLPKGALAKEVVRHGDLVTNAAMRGVIAEVKEISENNEINATVFGEAGLKILKQEDLFVVNPDKVMESKFDTKMAKEGEPIYKFGDAPWVKTIPDNWIKEIESGNIVGKDKEVEEDCSPSM